MVAPLVGYGLGTIAAGTLSRMLGKDKDYPTNFGNIRIKNGVAMPVGGIFAYDKGKSEDAKALVDASVQHLNDVIDGMGLSPEQRQGLNTSGITVGVISKGRPGAVSKAGFFFGDQGKSDPTKSEFLSGVKARDQGFQSPEEALANLSKFMLKTAISQDDRQVDWNLVKQNNPELVEEYEDYRYDQKEEGRASLGENQWLRKQYDKGGFDIPAKEGLDPQLIETVNTFIPQIKAENLGLNIEIPETFNQANPWTVGGKAAQLIGAGMTGAGLLQGTAGATAGASEAVSGAMPAATEVGSGGVLEEIIPTAVRRGAEAVRRVAEPGLLEEILVTAKQQGNPFKLTPQFFPMAAGGALIGSSVGSGLGKESLLSGDTPPLEDATPPALEDPLEEIIVKGEAPANADFVDLATVVPGGVIATVNPAIERSPLEKTKDFIDKVGGLETLLGLGVPLAAGGLLFPTADDEPPPRHEFTPFQGTQIRTPGTQFIAPQGGFYQQMANRLANPNNRLSGLFGGSLIPARNTTILTGE